MAKTVYVSVTAGNDANPGTQSQPVQSIAAANALVTIGAGDSVAIESGRYFGNFASDKAFGGFKNGTRYFGYGPTPTILDGGWKKWTVFISQGSNITLENLEICNAIYNVVEANGAKNVVSNFTVRNCHIHHADSTMGPIQTGLGFNCGIRLDYGNPKVLNCKIHHIGQYNEAYGIFMANCRDAVLDSNVLYFIRKQAMRDYYSLSSRIVNNFSFACEGGLDMAGGFSALVANNFVAQCDFGIIAKHCNNVQFLQSTWGLTQDQLPNRTRFWHNTIYDSMAAHMALAINLSVNAPDYLELTDVQHSIFAGSAYISLYDAPEARKDTVFTDYNIHPTNAMLGQGLYRRGMTSTSWTVLNTIADLRADSLAPWEQHGKQEDVAFVDSASNNLNPVIDHRAAIALASEWGDQVGARNAVISPYKWKSEPSVIINSNLGTPSALTKLVDGYGAAPNSVLTMASQVEQQSRTAWIICDLGAPKTINAFRWTPWTHQDWSNVQDFTLEVADSVAGPWTNVLTSTFPDYGGAAFSWELSQSYTTRYVRFTGLNNFLHGAGRPELLGTTNDRLVFAEIELGRIVAVGGVDENPTPPLNTILPSISGTLRANSTLTGIQGTWTNGLIFTYRWLRNGVAITGATNPTYLLVTADVGKAITYEVTASNSAGATVATSSPTTLIEAEPITPPPPGGSVNYWGILS